MKRTLSEYLFERFCDERRTPYRRIPESASKTPDYELFPETTPVVVEVKEIEPNAEERESERVMAARGWGNVLDDTPGGRVREKIRSASRQIKARARGLHPSLLVVCDQGHAFGHVEPYMIRVAMYGLEQIRIAIPPLSQGSPYPIGMAYGPERQMTPEHNTSISAITSIFMEARDVIKLFVYHNAFAKVPLDVSLLSPYDIRQFKLGEPPPGATADWVEVL